MNEVAEERLYGLVEIAERQQAVAQLALEGMASERIALGQEREQWIRDIGTLNEEVRATVLTAISESMARAGETGAEAFRAAAEPLAETVRDVSEQAARAETALRDLVQWARWRILAWGLAAIAGLAVLWWLATAALLWWDTSAVGAAQIRKAQLQTELSQLQANRDAWVAAGMLGKLDRCGPKKLPCVQVDERAGTFGDQNDYRIVRGY